RVDPDALDLGVFLDRRPSVLAAQAALPDSSERDRVARATVGVDPHGSGAQPRADAVSSGDVLGPHASGETVHRGVADGDRLVLIGERDQADDWPEDLFLCD